MTKKQFLTLMLLSSFILAPLTTTNSLSLALPSQGMFFLEASADEKASVQAPPPVAWTFDGDESGDEMGYAVATAGDVNGDGYDDVIVGARKDSGTASGEGLVYLFYGSPQGPSNQPDWRYGTGQKGSRLGVAVGTAGDVNGDGYDDVIVGADEYKQPDGGKVGAAFVFYGSKQGPREDEPDWTFVGDQKDARLGCSVGTAGDVNDDGWADVVVGAKFYTNGQDNEGMAFVFYGSESGLSSAPGWTGEIDQSGAGFGASVGTAGDVNRDGFDDLVVGAPNYTDGETDEGAAFVFLGSEEGLRIRPDWMDEADQEGAEFGTSVGTAGDVNGDNCSEVIVGSPHHSLTAEDAGAAFVFYGSPDGPRTVGSWNMGGRQSGSGFGIAVGTAGDMTGDGFDDVVVGANRYMNDQAAEGAAFLFRGSAVGLQKTATWMVEGDKADTDFGFSVGTAGDLDDDGYADLIVGAPLFRIETDLRGRALVYLGAESTVEIDFFIYLPLVNHGPE
jgi:hypothetical protein